MRGSSCQDSRLRGRDRGDARRDEAPGLQQRSEPDREPWRHVVDAGLPLGRRLRRLRLALPAPLANRDGQQPDADRELDGEGRRRSGAVLGLGGLLPVAATVIASTAAREHSHPKMKAAPLRVPPLESSTTM